MLVGSLLQNTEEYIERLVQEEINTQYNAIKIMSLPWINLNANYYTITTTLQMSEML
jgi:hypothetical protein